MSFATQADTHVIYEFYLEKSQKKIYTACVEKNTYIDKIIT